MIFHIYFLFSLFRLNYLLLEKEIQILYMCLNLFLNNLQRKQTSLKENKKTGYIAVKIYKTKSILSLDLHFYASLYFGSCF